MTALRLDTETTAHSAATALSGDVGLRPFRVSDLEAAQALSVQQQWPHRLEDWRFALAHGAGVVAERDGAVVGTALRWLWGTDRASLGLVIVSPALQGQGIGGRLMSALLQDAGRRHVLLYATAEGRALYARLGFCSVGEIRQHQGIALKTPGPLLAEGERLRPPDRCDGDVLAALDVKAAGLPRPSVLRQLLVDEQAVVFDRKGQAVGFSVLRRFGRGHVIGPVVAPDVASARALIRHWCNLYAGQFLRIDVDAESGLPEWLDCLGLRRVGRVTAMVRGKLPPRGAASGGWALISQSMG
ncbi:GNAT family N-acetyltransferase [Aquincola sp. S2]|uniref:GNAT family N-acetyltransferase n=1 Tax=Pseudaquabacterium terrae TaxID=2732868 RepID=A0ABX2EFV3_9BURK|nr:GNAT family N-acetyltransferase [Aquabacterium terrae]NRF67517.1 GNAT family N-acetyltransferase [Aquabacterium terrae]